MSNTKRVKAQRQTVTARSAVPDAHGTHLGELGRPGPSVALTFGWFGHVIRVNPGAGELELVDFMRKASKLDVGEDLENLASNVEALDVTMDFLQRQIHPDDWAVFWDLAKTHNQGTKDLLEVAMTITEKVASFPTGQPATSSGGQSTTGMRSSAGSSSLTTKALDLLPGRPDLQAAVIQAQEAQASAAAV